MPAPKDDTETAECYVKITKELSFDLTADEILTGLKGMEHKQKAQSDKVSLDDADLENVAGGVGDPRCSETFDEGEWCWFSDSCSVVISYYDDQPAQQKPSESPLSRITFHEEEESKPDLIEDFDVPF